MEELIRDYASRNDLDLNDLIEEMKERFQLILTFEESTGEVAMIAKMDKFTAIGALESAKNGIMK